MNDLCVEIPVTEYVLPDGRKKMQTLMCPADVGAKASLILDAGLCFEAELLTTGQVSLTITDPEEGDVAIAVCKNGPGVPESFFRMVREFDLEGGHK